MPKLFITAALLFACGVIALAQNREMEQALDDAFFRIAFNREKQAAIADFLELSELEATRFWPIYNEYEERRHHIGTQMVDLIEKYVARRPSLTDAEADAMMNAWQKNNKDLLDLRMKYYPKIKKALGAKAATGWYQMEEFIQTSARVTLLSDVPFIESQRLKEQQKQ